MVWATCRNAGALFVPQQTAGRRLQPASQPQTPTQQAHLAGDALLCRQHHPVLGQDSHAGAGVGDGLHGVPATRRGTQGGLRGAARGGRRMRAGVAGVWRQALPPASHSLYLVQPALGAEYCRPLQQGGGRGGGSRGGDLTDRGGPARFPTLSHASSALTYPPERAAALTES